MPSESSNPSASSSTSVGPFPIVAAVIGGIATICVFAMIIYLVVQRRRKHRLQDNSENGTTSTPSPDFDFDLEKQPSITLPPSVYYIQPQRSLSPPTPTPPMIQNQNVALQRPTITVITDVPAVSVTPQVDTPKTPKTPKWKLKRVPVPRFSRLPPTPVAITRTRSWMLSPRQLRKSLQGKRVARGLPSNVRPPIPAPVAPAPTSPLPVPTYLATSPTRSRSRHDAL